MASLDDLIDDTLVTPEDKLDMDIKDAFNEQADVHTDVKVFTSVNGVHEYANVSKSSLEAIKNEYIKYRTLSDSYNEFTITGHINKMSVENYNQIFNNKILEELHINSFTTNISKVNSEKVTRIMLEEMDIQKNLMKNQINETFDTFNKSLDDIYIKKDEIMDTIRNQIADITRLISIASISGNKDRVVYEGDKEVDFANTTFKEYLSKDEYDTLSNILNYDLVLFIYQILGSDLPTASDIDPDFNYVVYRDTLSMSKLENFYKSNQLDSALSVLVSYMFSSKDKLAKVRENNEKEEFGELRSNLADLGDSMNNLRYTKNVLEGLVALDNWVLREYNRIQSLI